MGAHDLITLGVSCVPGDVAPTFCGLCGVNVVTTAPLAVPDIECNSVLRGCLVREKGLIKLDSGRFGTRSCCLDHFS